MDESQTAAMLVPEAIYRRFFTRFGVSFVAMLLYSAFIVFRFYVPDLYDFFLGATDVTRKSQLFDDLHSILLAGACWRHGVNVYIPNACMGGGNYNYSPLLLRAALLGAGPAELDVIAIISGLLFCLSLSILPPVESVVEFVLRIVAVCSGAVLLALSTANFDIDIFVMTLIGIAFVLANRMFSLAGYGFFLIGAALKFYPVILLACIVRERWQRIFMVITVSALLVGIYWVHFSATTVVAVTHLPKGLPFDFWFGSEDLAYGLLVLHYLPVLTMHPTLAQYDIAVARPVTGPFIALTTEALIVVALFIVIIISPRYAKALARLDPQRGLFFFAGAMIVSFCFFATQNVDYRAIFLLLALPGLWTMGNWFKGNGDRSMQILLVSVVLLLWEAYLRNFIGFLGGVVVGAPRAVYVEIIFFLCREVLWWWVAIQLAACVLCFLRQSIGLLAIRSNLFARKQ
ncbi:hypothetical protein GCM10010909_14470 [Acidocella aquatica]|uniref:DUF2029 domain-containing protein n=1 Tax=Acidocella aquatica TaxID=1922313 RepID=A0ABQ6A530_9PROT|nr:hypothetical protein [Acidocella aquatica]GLR66767.1 hypothetical protein GCM10010909_14470 [Acidocella aquatica]